MFDRLGPALQRALAETRAANPAEAARLIQEALIKTPFASKDKPEEPRRERTSGLRRARKGLGETLAGLRGGFAAPDPHAPRAPKLADGAAFLRRTQQTSSGSRDYRLYVPATHQPRGLILMLHGCKQNAEDFAIGTAMNDVAEAQGFLVAYPAQAQSANPSSCWNWFRREDQSRGRGEPHILAEMTRAISAEYGISTSKVFVAGLSAGGAMAAVMAAAYPGLYAAAGIHSGLPCGAARDVQSAFAAMRGDVRPITRKHAQMPRLIVFHGTSDPTVAPRNAALLMAEAQDAFPAAKPVIRSFKTGTRNVEHTELRGADGSPQAECWMIAGAGHCWSGGDPSGSYAKPEGPAASKEMMRFFLGRPLQV